MGQAPVVSGPDRKLDASTEDVRHSLLSIVVKTTLVVAEGVVDMFFLSIKKNLLAVFIFRDPSRSRFF